jgi:hypothetical protein
VVLEAASETYLASETILEHNDFTSVIAWVLSVNLETNTLVCQLSN